MDEPKPLDAYDWAGIWMVVGIVFGLIHSIGIDHWWPWLAWNGLTLTLGITRMYWWKE